MNRSVFFYPQEFVRILSGKRKLLVFTKEKDYSKLELLENAKRWML